jgi:hypothetical protein
MRAFVAALILCAMVAVANAAASPTEEEKAACTPDAMKFCKPQLTGLFVTLRVYVCLSDHRKDLSRACDAVFKAHGL